MGVESNFHQLELVLLEALTNALLYGNLEVPSKVRDTKGEEIFWQLVEEREKDSNFGSRKIVLEVDCIGEQLRFKVKDEGAGFDWRNYLKSIDEGDLERVHDRGILLIQSYVDALHWNDRGNEVTFSIELGSKSIARRELENGAHTTED
jgi:anti-sigma regulatory factor (Ser/Thr protein kinase)